MTNDLTPATRPGFHPGRTAEVTVNGVPIGHVGELAPSAARHFEISGRVAIAELELAPILETVPFRLAENPSVYPHVDFDLSFLMPKSVPARSLVDATTEAADGLIESVRVFDEFTGGAVEEGQKALAIRYRLRAPDRTLEQREIGALREAMIGAAAKLGAELRGA